MENKAITVIDWLEFYGYRQPMYLSSTGLGLKFRLPRVHTGQPYVIPVAEIHRVYGYTRTLMRHAVRE